MKSIFQEAVQHLNSANKMLSQNKVPFDELEHSQVLCALGIVLYVDKKQL